jgi:hypothetical protein
MRLITAGLGAVAFAAALLGAAAPDTAPPEPRFITSAAPQTAPPPADPSLALSLASSPFYLIRYDHWTAADERGYSEFIRAIGESGCHTVDSCLHGTGNPFRASDPAGLPFRSDCADFPYILRAYYAWKRGLPFSYEYVVEPRGRTRDIRYTPDGNEVVERKDVLSLSSTGYALLDTLRDVISSATYRIHPDLDAPLPPDMYSPAIDPKSIRAGTMIYDPNGHVATIYRIDPDGRIFYIDAHPDESVTHGNFDMRFVRARPGMGAGFKNWRPVKLVGATRRSDGVLIGGYMELAKNREIADFSEAQYFGTRGRPATDSGWQSGPFVLNGEMLDYYDYVRAILAGGKLEFDPLKETADMVDSNCADLHYRVDAVKLALDAGIQNLPEPDTLPPNIYGTEGVWEVYSTPSRDARLKTAFKELHDQVQRFVDMYRKGDPKLVYKGRDLAGDLLRIYDARTSACTISYARSDGSQVSFGYEEARARLFKMSFDPYQCGELRWGAHTPAELATCRDDANKRAWYAAEQNLRNQIDRTYEARMDFTLSELGTPGPGRGTAMPPEIDTRAYLLSVQGVAAASATAGARNR